MILLKQLRGLFKEKMNFAIILITIQVVVMFSILFLAGVIVNNANTVNEEAYKTLSINIFFEDEINFNQLEDTLKTMSTKMPRAIQEFVLYTSVPSAKMLDVSISVYSAASIKDGRWVSGPTHQRETRILSNGRIFTEEEINSNKPVAVTTNYDVNERGPLILDGQEFEIIGELYNRDVGDIVSVPLKSLGEINIQSLSIDTSSILNDSQFKVITDELDKVAAGKYTYIRNLGKVPNAQSLARTIIGGSVFMLLTVIGTIILIFSYMIKKSSYRLGVWKLLGCGHIRAAAIYTLEMASVTLPSIIVGAIIFIILKEVYLVELYPYMETFYSCKIYFGLIMLVFVIIMLAVFIFSIINTRGKVRKLLA